jgi:nitrous oxidase accessory protein
MIPFPAGTQVSCGGLVPLLLVALLTTTPTGAVERVVPPGTGTLQQAIATAGAGDILRLGHGTYSGNFIVDRPLSLVGSEGAVLDGGGSGRVVTLDAPRTRLEGVTIVGSGDCLSCEDGAVYLSKRATGAVVAHNRLEGNLIGINLKGPRDAVVRDNTIVGRDDLPMSERGNGVQLWNSPGSVVDGNLIRLGRDGIFVNVSDRNRFTDNRLEGVRFGVHYMYANDSEVSGNVSRGNHLGFALMFSHRLVVTGNRSLGDRDHGLLLNYANESRVAGNEVRGGAEKCVFIYNANNNRFSGNRFEGCDIGIHFTAGSEKNTIVGNAFVANRTQVKYVGTRHIEWSSGGRGNYWSDNPAFDLDGDGIGDRAYRPNDMVDQLVWRHPLAKLLLNSPAVHLVRWAQSAFPPLYPGGVVDLAPLMAEPDLDFRKMNDGLQG